MMTAAAFIYSSIKREKHVSVLVDWFSLLIPALWPHVFASEAEQGWEQLELWTTQHTQKLPMHVCFCVCSHTTVTANDALSAVCLSSRQSKTADGKENWIHSKFGIFTSYIFFEGVKCCIDAYFHCGLIIWQIFWKVNRFFYCSNVVKW